MYKLFTETEAENIPANFTGVAENSNGYKEYLVNGKLHRDGGLPAVEHSNGDKVYYVNGQLHRDGGLPAIVIVNSDDYDDYYNDNDTIYYVNGKQLTEAEAKSLAPSCNGKVVLIDGVEYTLTVKA